MTRSHTFDLLSNGRASAKAGEKAVARRYLERALSLDPPADERLEVLYWLSEVLDDPREKRALLEEILANNLGDARARRKLAILDGKLKPEEIVDPDRLPAQAGGDKNVAARSFTCPNCGGRMSYAPDGASLVCEYCESRQAMQRGSGAAEDDFLVAMATAKAQNRPVQMQVLACAGCGVSFSLAPETITTTCPYCQTPFAVEQIEVRSLDAPDSILPFRVNTEQARERVKDWLAENPPEGPLKLSRLTGVYLPVWLFSIGGQVDWTGSVVVEKREIPVSGTRAVNRANLLVAAGKALPQDLAPALDGFDLDDLQPYDARYLADFPAESFRLPAAEASLKARDMARRLELDAVRETAYDREVLDFSLRTTNMLVEGYRLALVPLWLGFYQAGQRRFDLAVNGQTGAITADRPEGGMLSWVKSWF